MADKKSDRRVSKTQKAIRESLIELLAEKDISKITIQELADKADVNRVTIYKHYYDIYDLYDNVKKDILTELGLLMLKYQEMSAEDFTNDFVQYIEDNPKLFKMIFSPYNTSEIKEQFCKMIEGVFHIVWTERLNADLTDARIKYFCIYHAKGCIAIFENWVNENFSQSREVIAGIISEMNKNAEKNLIQ